MKVPTMHMPRWLLFIVVAALGVVCACAGPTTATNLNHRPSSPALLVAMTDPVGDEGLSAEEALLLNADIVKDENFDQADLTVADPLEGFNRAMFFVNDKLYFWVLKPLALGYRAVVPQPARRGVRNFFYNLAAPVRIINNILQGKGRAAEAEVTRFLYNTTVGVLGFGNPAQRYPGLSLSEEDLGQTLGRYGVGDGFYLVLPGLGPTTLRDSLGMVGDYFFIPVNYYVDSFSDKLILKSYITVNDTSLRIGDYEALKNAALDPYQALRNGYLQLRRARIKE